MYTMDVFNFHILTFRLCGLWSNKSDGNWYRLWTATFFIVAAIGFPVSQLACILFVNSVNAIVEHLILSSTVVTVSMKAAIVFVNKNRLAELFNAFDEMDRNMAIEPKNYRNIFDLIVKNAKKLTIMCLCAYLTAWTMLVIQVLFSSTDSIGWSSTHLYPSEYLHQPSIYVGGLIFQAASNFIFCCLAAALDTYPVILIHLLIGHINVLKLQLHELTVNNSSDYVSYQRLIRACKNYENILRCTDMMKPMLSFAFLCQFGVSGVTICMSTYQLTVMDFSNLSKFSFVVEYSVCMFLEIFVPTYIGSSLASESKTLPHDIFKTNWINQSQKYKTAMMLLVERTLRPICIAAGSIFDLNLSTLLKILKTAYSLFALLKNV